MRPNTGRGSGTRMTLLGVDRKLGLALVCPSCGGLGASPALDPTPRAYPAWNALPLPRGWRWAVSSIDGPTVQGQGNRIVALCSHCAHAEHDEAPGFLAGGDLSAIPPVMICPHCMAGHPVVRAL